MHITKSQIKYITSLAQKKYREKSGRYVIEGYKLIKEALDSNVSFEYIVYNKTILSKDHYKALFNELYDVTSDIYWAHESEIQKLSTFETAEGLLAVVKVVESPEIEGPCIIGLDAVNDPGNLGTIIRTADWFGVKTLLLGKGTVDVYNPKVVRATMGSLFHVNIVNNVDLVQLVQDLQKKKYRIRGAALKESVSLKDLQKYDKQVVLFGNESHGLSKELLSLCDDRFTISQGENGQAESLNVGISVGISLAELV